ncbi:MAG: ComEA family DNA-binding protein [Gammaproteobacteria bacterium]|nr:ComEA family DNA-binding protein [Gammaproteobacteria bacterium]
MKKILSLFIPFVLFSGSVFAAPVNINEADASEISAALKGIGLKKAQAIVDYREQNGSFATAQDLVFVKGIGKKTVSKLKEDILLKSE